MTPMVYEYSDSRTYLRDVLAYKKRHNPLFSMRAWAKQMGFQCHTSLVFFLNGKRKLRPEHLDKINKGLRLTGNEDNYFRALVHRESAVSDSERTHYESRLSLLRPTQEDRLLDNEKFRLVSDWVHMAILEMTKLKGFRGAPEWITNRLKFKLPQRHIEDAIERLVQLGLLRREGESLIKTNERLTTPIDRASESVREHHKQVLKNAIQAIDEQDVSERMYNACAMTINASRMEQAKELIVKFRADLAKLMEKDGGDETYQLAIQFFKLTDSNKKNEGLQ